MVFPLVLGSPKEEAFIILKNIFIEALVLAYFNLDREI